MLWILFCAVRSPLQEGKTSPPAAGNVPEIPYHHSPQGLPLLKKTASPQVHFLWGSASVWCLMDDDMMAWPLLPSWGSSEGPSSFWLSLPLRIGCAGTPSQMDFCLPPVLLPPLPSTGMPPNRCSVYKSLSSESASQKSHLGWSNNPKTGCKGRSTSPCLKMLPEMVLCVNVHMRLPTSMDHGKSKRVPEKHLFLFYWLCQSLCVDHNKLWKILREIGIPEHLTCLLRNLYAAQEATVRTGHGITDWFQIGKGVCQGCILSPCLVKSLSRVRLFATPWIHQAPPSMGFSRQEYCSGVPLPTLHRS